MGTGKHSNVEKKKTDFRQRLKQLERSVDFWRLLIAFVLAVFTCVVIHRQSAESSYAAQSEIRNVMIVVDNSEPESGLYVLPQTFFVNLRVAVDTFHYTTQYKPEQFVIRVDKKRLHEKVNALPLNTSAEPLEVRYEILAADVVQKPEGVALRNGKIGEITVKCDRIAMREVPVHLYLDRRQEIAEWTYECKLEKEAVEIAGPNYLLARIASISTEPIVISGTQSYRGMVRLEKPSDSDVTLSDSQIEYEVIPQKDSKGYITQSFNQLQVFFLMRENSQVEPVTHPGETQYRVDVRLHGPAKALKKIKAEELRVVCDLTPFSEAGKWKVKLRILNMPKEVQLEGFWPKEELFVELRNRHDASQTTAPPLSIPVEP